MQAATAPVCVLTGGPGCGKTTTTKYIVDLWRATGKRIALCAPTGQTCFSCVASLGHAAHATLQHLLRCRG